MKTHTPGPWISGFVESGWGLAISKPHNQCLVFVQRGDGGILPTEEDARLMSASPDLLAASKDCLRLCGAVRAAVENSVMDMKERRKTVIAISDLIDRLLKAIAKAEGTDK